MGGRRSTPPLFELLQDADAQIERSDRAGHVQRPDQPAGKAPEPRHVEPERPRPPRREPAEPPPQAPPEPDDREPWLLDGSKRVSVPLNLVLIGVVGLILVAVVGFSLAWKLGNRSSDSRLVARLDELAPEEPVVDPLVRDIPVNDGLMEPQPAPEAGDRASGRAPTGPGRFLLPGGTTRADPRRPGHNYLWIASRPAKIDRDEARRLLEFLAASGLDAVAVPVDPDAGGSKNPRYYDVFVLQGIPSDQFSERASERQALERRVADLGRRWQREHAGTTDFRDPLWKKHQP